MQLRRLRALLNDPLLVRSGRGMAPTDVALHFFEIAGRILQDADQLFGAPSRTRAFDPSTSDATFRIASSDYLDPLFLPGLFAQVKRAAPHVRMELMPLSDDFDYRRELATGAVDLVIGNWLEPPGELHLGKLYTDEVVCLVSEDHPVARMNSRQWSIQRYLECEHVAPTPLTASTPGVIDARLRTVGLRRNVVVRSAHFGLIPLMVAQSLVILTTGRLFCSRFVDTLPVRIVRCPVSFPPLVYYQLWHDLTHASSSARWLREQVRDAAIAFSRKAPPHRRSSAGKVD
jgi:DNA-binding transcriptional LysR family regulator